LLNLTSDGDVQELADEINDSLYSVSTDLLPLDPSLIPDVNVDGEDLFVDGLSGFTIDPYQVERKLASVNPSKASGPDNVSNWFWRDFSVWLAEPLCAIFNCSIRHGIVGLPTAWKQTDVVPVPKTNPPTDIDKDLRPISLTSQFLRYWNLSWDSGS